MANVNVNRSFFYCIVISSALYYIIPYLSAWSYRKSLTGSFLSQFVTTMGCFCSCCVTHGGGYVGYAEVAVTLLGLLYAGYG